MKTTLKGFCQELNKVQGLKEGFLVIVLDDSTVELHFSDKAIAYMDDENGRTYKRFERLLDKYSLEYDLIRYTCIEVSVK